MDTSNDIAATLMQFADERLAAISQRFFKTGVGEFGEGDCFLGIANPKVKLVVKEAWKQTSSMEKMSERERDCIGGS